MEEYMKSNNNYHTLRIHTFVFLFFSSFLLVTAQGKVKITILHTNDTHSQVEPTEKTSSPTSDMGGYARRMGVIEKIRSEEKNVILLDAGDYWQGTPYFNFYNGRIEIDAMNRMRYDTATLGNHEFDNGVDSLAAVLAEAKFPVISSNYTFENPQLAEMIKPYIIMNVDGVRVGIMGLTINPEGLIAQSNYKGVTYLDPVFVAKETSGFLKEELKCDLIVCLSHLGADPSKSEVTDFDIARATEYIDIIIGGHSHQIIDNTTEKNLVGKDVIIAQMGKSGLYLGRIDLELVRK